MRLSSSQVYVCECCSKGLLNCTIRRTPSMHLRKLRWNEDYKFEFRRDRGHQLIIHGSATKIELWYTVVFMGLNCKSSSRLQLCGEKYMQCPQEAIFTIVNYYHSLVQLWSVALYSLSSEDLGKWCCLWILAYRYTFHHYLPQERGVDENKWGSGKRP